MIKALAMAVPTFTISCFKFHAFTCDEMNSAIENFWWRSNKNGDKLLSKIWKFLCLIKQDGGLGFHDLSSFNTALLAKQS